MSASNDAPSGGMPDWLAARYELIEEWSPGYVGEASMAMRLIRDELRARRKVMQDLQGDRPVSMAAADVIAWARSVGAAEVSVDGVRVVFR